MLIFFSSSNFQLMGAILEFETHAKHNNINHLDAPSYPDFQENQSTGKFLFQKVLWLDVTGESEECWWSNYQAYAYRSMKRESGRGRSRIHIRFHGGPRPLQAFTALQSLQPLSKLLLAASLRAGSVAGGDTNANKGQLGPTI